MDKIDFDNHVIIIDEQLIEVGNVVKVGTPKSEESNRRIAAPAEVFEALSERQQEVRQHKEWLEDAYHDNNLVLCRDDGMPIRPRGFTHLFTDLLARHKLKKIRFHDLRHSCATLMLQSGVAMKTASEILGHSSIAITADLYTHVLDSEKKEAAAQVGSLLFGNGRRERTKVIAKEDKIGEDQSS